MTFVFVGLLHLQRHGGFVVITPVPLADSLLFFFENLGLHVSNVHVANLPLERIFQERVCLDSFHPQMLANEETLALSMRSIQKVRTLVECATVLPYHVTVLFRMLVKNTELGDAVQLKTYLDGSGYEHIDFADFI